MKRLILAALLASLAAAQGIPGIRSVAPTVAPAITVKATTGAQSTDGLSVTTPAIDATGGNLILVGVAYYGLNNNPACGNNGGSGSATPLTAAQISDSTGSTGNTAVDPLPIQLPRESSNTYTKVWTNAGQGVESSQSALFCVGAPSVSSSMTFSVNSPGSQTCFPAIAVLVLSNTGATSGNCGTDQVGGDGNGNGGAEVFTSGLILTPTQDNEILVSVLALGNTQTALAINDSFTISYAAVNTGAPYSGAFGIAMAYLIQTTATANHAQWTWTGSQSNGAYSNMASFFQ